MKDCPEVFPTTLSFFFAAEHLSNFSLPKSNSLWLNNDVILIVSVEQDFSAPTSARKNWITSCSCSPYSNRKFNRVFMFCCNGRKVAQKKNVKPPIKILNRYLDKNTRFNQAINLCFSSRNSNLHKFYVFCFKTCSYFIFERISSGSGTQVGCFHYSFAAFFLI